LADQALKGRLDYRLEALKSMPWTSGNVSLTTIFQSG
jgi:hypothetical protein